jgi:phosphodiesterase/alkaline phosphatase D-like protein
MSVKAAAWAVVLASWLGLGAQPDGAVRWVWSGGVTSRSAVITARAFRSGVPVTLRLAHADAASPPERFDARADADGIASFDLKHLSPATRYRYEVSAEGAPPAGGRFQTFGEGPWSFRIAFASCAETGSASPVFDAIREAAPDLFIHTGDLHYEDIAKNDPGRFRRAFDSVMSSPTQSRLYRSVPIAYTWDDHDFGGNDSGASSAAGPAALAVYRQFVPHYPLQAGDRAGIHQAFTIGRVRVIMTDARSQRTPGRRGGEAGTMLGAAQLQWLRGELSAAAAAPLVIWVSTVPWIAEQGSSSDNWGGYAREREAIANHIDSLGLTRRVLMLSGDAHMLAIDDGTHSNYATGTGRQGRGFVVMHAAPLDRPTSQKGGPYSHGTVRQRGQFGLVEVTDDGRTLRVELSGRDRAGAPVRGMRLALACAGGACDVTPSGR